MIIAVTGGKGGTGKTTVALSLALTWRKPVTYIDADVETPNAAILLGTEMERIGAAYKSIPVIDEEKCIKCGLCAHACPVAALVFIPGKVPLFIEENCVGCMLCKDVCPVGAIREEKKEIGIIREGEHEHITLYDGLLDPTEEEAAPLVEELLRRALNDAKGDVIIDTAAGIHCNVARAIMPADKVIIVTEPTPYGVHDLEKIVKLVETLEKPYEIYANKWGINGACQKRIEEIAREKGVKLTKIQFSEDFARKYAKGAFEPVIQ
ncbi:MAG: hypothetical protein PWP76_368 [Candidatus Diapherotrites archaeon]|nr:hypothetical protein [Candidatus Diapherotrites archaeon]MDN5366720.1 hypothetical protein [Candidatus Diapherotrites archaeon]